MNIFEQPWLLCSLAVIVLLAILTFRSVLPEKKRWWQLVIPLMPVAAAFGLDMLVQTDNEKVTSVVKQTVRAAELENLSQIRLLLAPDYHDSMHRSPNQLIHHLKTYLKPDTIKQIKVISFQKQITGSRAKAMLIVIVKFEKQSPIAQNYTPNFFVKSLLHLKKQPDNNWLTDEIEITEINRVSVNWRSLNW